MKEEAIRKINKFGHIGQIITKIIRIFLIVGFIGALIGEVVLLWLPADLFKITVEGRLEATVNKHAVVHISRDNVTVNELDAETSKHATRISSIDINDEEYVIGELYSQGDNIIGIGTTKAPKEITVPRVRGAVALGILIIVCSYVLFYFVGKLCKAIETCETPFAEEVISSLTVFAYTLVGYVILSGTLGSIAGELVVGSSSVNIGINGTSILVALAVYVLTVVFKYGAILQQESDETL